MAFGPITSWQIDGETMETVTYFIFLCSKITADGDCSPEIKRHLLLGRKGMANLDSVLKNRDITVPTKVHIVKAMVFPVVMYECESLTIKEAVCWRIAASTWVWTGSKRWWRTGRPGMLQSVGSQRVGHNWVTRNKVHLGFSIKVLWRNLNEHFG